MSRKYLVIVASFVTRKIVFQRSVFDLLREDVLLVEEEYEGRVGEPADVADGGKQLKGFVHSVEVHVFG